MRTQYESHRLAKRSTQEISRRVEDMSVGEQAKSCSKRSRIWKNNDATSEDRSTNEQLLLLMASPSGYEAELMRFRNLCPRTVVYTRLREVLNFFDGLTPGCCLVFLPNQQRESEMATCLDTIRTLRQEIDRRLLPLSLGVYVRQPVLDVLFELFPLGIKQAFTFFETDHAWKTKLVSLWTRWEGQITELAFRRNLKSIFKNLSPPLQDTAKMLYMGCSNQEMALAAGKKLRTIEQRRADLMAALGANNFAELIRYLEAVLETTEIMPTCSGLG